MIKSIEFRRELGNNQPTVVKNIQLGAPETSGLWVKSIKGIGPGKASINTTDMASSDGGIFNSARSEIRNITLTLGLLDYTDEAGNYHSVEDVRRDTYKLFGKKRQVEIRIHTDYGVERDSGEEFVLYTYGYVESCEPDIFNKQETMAISIICPNPNFYSETGAGGVDFSATNSIFEFPFSNEVLPEGEYSITEDTALKPGKEYFEVDPNNPGQYMMTPDLTYDSEKTYYEYNNKIKFADILEIATKTLTYDGEIEVGVTIRLNFHDNATGVRIYKVYDDHTEIMSIDDTSLASIAGGSGISPGDLITINTVKGNKYATLFRNGTYYNIMNALGRNPNWFQLDFGDNVFTYDADTGASFMEVSIDYDEAYEGI